MENLPVQLLAAVSGGLDSCVLLDALVLCGKHPTVVHYDHGWRSDSREDAAFVGQLAASYGLPFLEEKGGSPGIKSEGAARNRRYEFFARAARTTGCSDLALGHHAEDQVETLLLQLLRGSGSHARGMRESEVRAGLRLHRPFLWLDRSQVREHARVRGLHWREDRSNDDRRYLRNRIRHELLPFLEERFSPHVRRSLLRFCRIRIAEEEWMTELVRKEAEGNSLSIADLGHAPLGRQRRVVHLWLRRRGVPDISLADVESVRGLACGERNGKEYPLAGGWHAVRKDGAISLKHLALSCASINT
ncbi:tRNA lysidine(34) synthetase TilS [Methylacidimicrobium sp. B4]|uniref:tRNA lysidine(34) synthetase TilS n=1 Tax=Methylacidimicrobium sp. B4 TaxID=2796139 RepID=UPI001A8EBDA4|nr:tRNA lysidine(34) synthetase TilS [Methylacidimicrobium sp. B4]QSR84045.1 tRNA lysidine(34) synthetase TilS [Methylacidimicrobium sp. B4]